jgi:hypothetical protein
MGPRRIISTFEDDSRLFRNVGIQSPINTASHIPDELTPDLFLGYYHHRRHRHCRRHYHHNRHQIVKAVHI